MSKLLLGIALAALALAAIPLSNALDPNGDCRFNETIGNTIVPPPPDGLLNWLPDCIIIRNGDTVAWTNADAVPVHAMEFPALFNAVTGRTVTPNAANPGCLTTTAGATSKSLGAYVVPEVDHDTMRITFDEERNALGFELEGARAAQAAAAVGNPAAPLVQSFECTNAGANAAAFSVADGVVTLKYGCIFHHGAMTGTIKIVL